MSGNKSGDNPISLILRAILAYPSRNLMVTRLPGDIAS